MLETPEDSEKRIGRRLALVVEYDGTNYNGFQLQAQEPTIQGEIEVALQKFTGEFTRIRGASRTDSGAHAKGQVVDFITHSRHEVEQFPKALNHFLPRDIVVQSAHRVPLGFNSRRNATARVYRYTILNKTWPSPLGRQGQFWVREELAVSKMAAAAQALVGIHDFRALGVGHPADQSAVRQVFRWQVWRENDTVIIECEATGFLRHQIRRANGLLVQVGKGRSPESIVGDALMGNPAEEIPAEGNSGSRNGPAILPARGLCLMQVRFGPLGTDLERFSQSNSVNWDPVDQIEGPTTGPVPQLG